MHAHTPNSRARTCTAQDNGRQTFDSPGSRGPWCSAYVLISRRPRPTAWLPDSRTPRAVGARPPSAPTSTTIVIGTAAPDAPVLAPVNRSSCFSTEAPRFAAVQPHHHPTTWATCPAKFFARNALKPSTHRYFRIDALRTARPSLTTWPTWGARRLPAVLRPLRLLWSDPYVFNWIVPANTPSLPVAARESNTGGNSRAKRFQVAAQF